MSHNFSSTTITELGHWLSGGAELNTFSALTTQECQLYRLSRSTTLYRGLKSERELNCFDEIVVGATSVLNYNGWSSWTYDSNMARNFVLDDGTCCVVSCELRPDQSMVDVTRLNPRFVMLECGGFSEEQEVIAQPGDFNVKLEFYSSPL